MNAEWWGFTEFFKHTWAVNTLGDKISFFTSSELSGWDGMLGSD